MSFIVSTDGRDRYRQARSNGYLSQTPARQMQTRDNFRSALRFRDHGQDKPDNFYFCVQKIQPDKIIF